MILLENFYFVIKSIFRKLGLLNSKKLSIQENCNQLNAIPPKYKDTSWVNKPVTEDQARIEMVLKKMPFENKSWLHVGIGNSNIAKSFSNRLLYIDGITVMKEEKVFSDNLKFNNYNTFVLNKYSPDLKNLNKTYDLIIDNNLSSFACCRAHYSDMIQNFIKLLKPNGKILTDKLGMNYAEDYAFPISFDDLKKLEKQHSVKVSKVTDFVVSIEKI